MLNSKVIFKASTALVVAFVAATMCLLVVASAEAESSTGANPRGEGSLWEGSQDPSGTRTNPLKFVTEESPPPRGAAITKVEVQCPSRHVAIGGGYNGHYSETSRGSPWRILENRPSTSGMTPPDRLIQGAGWVVTAYSASPDLPPFTAHAVCLPASVLRADSPVTYPSQTTNITFNGKAQLTPSCGPNRKAIAGGYDLLRYPNPFESRFVRLIRSQPNPGNEFRSWIVAAHNTDHFARHEMTAYSVCLKDNSVKNLHHKDQSETGRCCPATKVVTANTRPCQGDTYLLSGGAGVADRDAADVEWVHSRPGPGSQADPPLNWSARIKALGKFTVHAFAMCGTLGDQQTRR